MPGGAPYIHRCFVVFRNALITFYGGATAAVDVVVVPRAVGDGWQWRTVTVTAAAAAVAATAVVPSGACRPVRFSWLFHSRPTTSQHTATHREHTTHAAVVRRPRQSIYDIVFFFSDFFFFLIF